jgi:3-hydroxyacyl-[acyl-carrier-protein] dehydratase
MRWMWIDAFQEFEPGQRAVSVKNVTMAEEHLHDHWPGWPIHPPTLMIEGMAQTGGILVGQMGNFQHDVVLAKISKAEFTDTAGPGDQLTYEAVLENYSDQAASVAGTVRKNGQVIGEISLMFSHADNAMQGGLDLPEHFVWGEQFTRLIAPFTNAEAARD